MKQLDARANPHRHHLTVLSGTKQCVKPGNKSTNWQVLVLVFWPQIHFQARTHTAEPKTELVWQFGPGCVAFYYSALLKATILDRTGSVHATVTTSGVSNHAQSLLQAASQGPSADLRPSVPPAVRGWRFALIKVENLPLCCTMAPSNERTLRRVHNIGQLKNLDRVWVEMSANNCFTNGALKQSPAAFCDGELSFSTTVWSRAARTKSRDKRMNYWYVGYHWATF